MPDLCDDLLLWLRLVLHTHLLHLGLGLWLRLIGDCLAMLLGLRLRLMLMLHAWTGRWLFLLFLVVVVALVFVIVLGEVAFRVAQRHVRLALMLLQIDRLVQIVVHNVILGRLLADVVVRRGHANQVDLMEGEALGADPRVLLALLAVVEDLAAQRLVGVVAEDQRENLSIGLGLGRGFCCAHPELRSLQLNEDLLSSVDRRSGSSTSSSSSSLSSLSGFFLRKLLCCLTLRLLLLLTYT